MISKRKARLYGFMNMLYLAISILIGEGLEEKLGDEYVWAFWPTVILWYIVFEYLGYKWVGMPMFDIFPDNEGE